MAKYVVLFSYTSETWARMITDPGDRTAAVRKMAESMGWTLESLYWMFGPYDGFGVAEVPDSVTAAAASLALTRTGAFKHVETHELLSQQQLDQALAKVAESGPAYQPPGRQG